MNNWSRTSPLITSLQALRAREGIPSYDDWSVAELLQGERSAPSVPVASPVPVSSTGEPVEPALLPQSDWLADLPWSVAPAPPPGLRPMPATSEDPFERFTNRMRRSVISSARRGPSEPPRDYPSYLGPIPRSPDWEEVPAGATPWSPLANPPHATDWDRIYSGGECYSSEDGLVCTTQGGRRVSVPSKEFPPGTRIAPGDRFYHSYRISDGPVAEVPSNMQGVIDRPTRGPSGHVLPATPQGTRNQATPASIYFPTLGLASGHVRSYLTTDQTGARVVVNVTEPWHPLYPGVVVRYETESPAGGIIRNEGIGRGWLQGPGGLASGRFNNWVWEGQAQDILGSRGPRRPARPLGQR